MRAIDGLLAGALIGPARDHLFHHEVTRLIDRLSQMWARHPRAAPALRDCYPAAWHLWFAPDARDEQAERAGRLMRAFSGS